MTALFALALFPKSVSAETICQKLNNLQLVYKKFCVCTSKISVRTQAWDVLDNFCSTELQAQPLMRPRGCTKAGRRSCALSSHLPHAGVLSTGRPSISPATR